MVPRVLGADHDGLLVDARAGTDKLYVIKDLDALFRAEDARRSLPLGIRSALDFGEQTFTDESAPVAAWFRRLVQDQTRFYSAESRRVLTAPGTLRLGGQNLDDAEEIGMEAIPVDELKRRIFAGEIRDAKTVAGILAYLAVLSDRGV